MNLVCISVNLYTIHSNTNKRNPFNAANVLTNNVYIIIKYIKTSPNPNEFVEFGDYCYKIIMMQRSILDDTRLIGSPEGSNIHLYMDDL